VKPLSGQPKQVTQFKAGRVLWPDISKDGRTIVFERNFGIWALDVDSGRAAEVPIRRRGASIGPVTRTPDADHRLHALSLSPDGRKVAFVARGEIFAASARDGGDAARVTRSLANEAQIMWAPDSRRIVYVSERDDVNHIFMYDFGRVPRRSSRTRRKATTRRSSRRTARCWRSCATTSPVGDGPRVEGGEGGRTGFISPSPRKPRVVGGQQVGRVSRPEHANRSETRISCRGRAGEPAGQRDSEREHNVLSWSPDGTFLVFNTSQRTEDTSIRRVDLTLQGAEVRRRPVPRSFRTSRAAAAARRHRTRQCAGRGTAKPE
jgi:hypothetical protein